jgi:DNA helicase-2/ATP-dependent DNA helicase PcrA
MAIRRQTKRTSRRAQPTLFELSEKKQQILAHEGHLLVTGGPGAGKTTISIIKADRLVSGALRPGQKVLFLSFARATVARVGEALDEHSQNRAQTRSGVDVDTYHAFFWRLLKTHGYLVGLPRALEILTPPAQAIALSTIRHEFGPAKKLNDAQKAERSQRENAELQRLAFKEGRVCFDLFAGLGAQILTGSERIRKLVSSAYPVIILDEFQDTNAGQWDVVQQLGIDSTLIALADEEQRIYDFIGADPERLNHFKQRFSPSVFDLGNENHRSSGTDIARFGNDIVKGKLTGKYQGMRLVKFAANQNQAIASLKGQALQARKRLMGAKGNDWGLAILVPTKQLMRQVSDAFRTAQPAMPVINHHAAIDMAGAILAAEIIAFLLQPRPASGGFKEFTGSLCNFFRGKGGDDPSNADIAESLAIDKALQKAVEAESKGKEPPAKSIIRPIRAGYEQASALKPTGDPDKDWLAVRDLLAGCGCKRLAQVAEEARNVRLLDRGTQLREALSLNWRDNGTYRNALDIVRQAFVQEHFATSTRRESGVVVMNMHKAKGKQFDEVIVFEGWPRYEKKKIVSNPHRIVRGNVAGDHLTHARYNFRVSVTRAKVQTTIMTPETDPCILLLQKP